MCVCDSGAIVSSVHTQVNCESFTLCVCTVELVSSVQTQANSESFTLWV